MEVRVVRLEPMHVAYTQAYGATPEAEAWATLLAWAGAKGLLGQRPTCRFFGYDDLPEDARGRHGYETWISLESEGQSPRDEPVRGKAFEGGLYAVARCRLADSVDTWRRLHAWVGGSVYGPGTHQWLEEHLALPGPPWQNILLDLYHPLAESPLGGVPHE
jgi:DNA gyrase inhibitor GyrI